MRAAAYQISDPEIFSTGGPAMPSMNISGFVPASVAKKNSGPDAIQAVPSFNSFPSSVATIASRNPGLFALAISINCTALDFSAAAADAGVAAATANKALLSNMATTPAPKSPARLPSFIASLLDPETRFCANLTSARGVYPRPFPPFPAFFVKCQASHQEQR